MATVIICVSYMACMYSFYSHVADTQNRGMFPLAGKANFSVEDRAMDTLLAVYSLKTFTKLPMPYSRSCMAFMKPFQLLAIL